LNQASTALAAAADAPFAIVVEAEIVPERTEEFLDVMEKDAVGSRKVGKMFCVVQR